MEGLRHVCADDSRAHGPHLPHESARRTHIGLRLLAHRPHQWPCRGLRRAQALEHRDRTGSGLAIDLSQYELGLGVMAPALLDYLANGANPEPSGNRHPLGAWAPHGIYRCAGDDRWVAIAVRNDQEWMALARVMGSPALAADPRFATHAERIAHQDELDAVVEHWTSTLDRYEIARTCSRWGLQPGPVQDAADLTGRDAQLPHGSSSGTTVAENRGE